MDSEQSFLRAICEAPADDTPRLVYADWLDERGEAERAEFIRVQCELAKPLHTPDKDGFHQMPYTAGRLYGRERELLNANAARWSCWPTDWVADGLEGERGFHGWRLDGVEIVYDRGGDADHPVQRRCLFRRGFVESIACACADWLAHGPAVVAAQPVTAVRLTDKGPLRGTWWTDTGAPLRENLPRDIFVHLYGPGSCEWAEDGGSANGTWMAYESDAEAEADLSNACVAWARGRAGLPPLDFRTPISDSDSVK